jgi:hypothetical protein
MLNDFENVNRILAELAEQGTLEPMVEPIDEDDCHPMDYADVTGLWDEMYPEPMVDTNGILWYTH